MDDSSNAYETNSSGDNNDLELEERDDLTQEQTEKLVQFQSLSSIDSVDECIDALKSHDWDLEKAVDSHFSATIPDEIVEERNVAQIDISDSIRYRGGPGAAGGGTSRHRAENFVQHESRTTPFPGIDVRIVPAVRPLTWSGLLVHVFTLPFRFVFRTVWDVIETVWSFFSAFRAIRGVEAEEDVRNFISKFESKFGTLHPTFIAASYSQAVSKSRSDLKFLLVYLHGDDHQDTEAFCRHILCTDEFTTFVNNNMLFWACNVSSREGGRVSRLLREHTYPFFAIICLHRGRQTVVGRLEGAGSVSDLTNWISQVKQLHEPDLIVERNDRESRLQTDLIRKSQDAEYVQSLEADRKKREEKEAAAEVLRQEEEKRLEALREEQEEKEALERRKESLRKVLPDEPESGDPLSVKVLLKLPDGSRIERRFRQDQSLTDLYNFVFCHEDMPNYFTIVRNFPRKELTLHAEDGGNGPTFAESELTGNEVLFVQDNEA